MWTKRPMWAELGPMFGNLKLFQNIEPEIVSRAQEDPEWEAIDMVEDSGASATYIGEDMLTGIPSKMGEASCRGVQHEVANWVGIPNLGEKKFKGLPGEGTGSQGNVWISDSGTTSVSARIWSKSTLGVERAPTSAQLRNWSESVRCWPSLPKVGPNSAEMGTVGRARPTDLAWPQTIIGNSPQRRSSKTVKFGRNRPTKVEIGQIRSKSELGPNVAEINRLGRYESRFVELSVQTWPKAAPISPKAAPSSSKAAPSWPESRPKWGPASALIWSNLAERKPKVAGSHRTCTQGRLSNAMSTHGVDLFE